MIIFLCQVNLTRMRSNAFFYKKQFQSLKQIHYYSDKRLFPSLSFPYKIHSNQRGQIFSRRKNIYFPNNLIFPLKINFTQQGLIFFHEYKIYCPKSLNYFFHRKFLRRINSLVGINFSQKMYLRIFNI